MQNLIGQKFDADKFIHGTRDLFPQHILNDYFKQHGARWWCWGAHNFVDHKGKMLGFKVSGLLFKGWVYVRCNGADLMDFMLVSTHGNIKHVETDLYIDRLFDRMDKNIELA